MASHIACEATRKGLETQVATLTTGYDNEINRLQAKITALAGDKTAINEALREQHEAQMEQQTAEIVRLKAVQSEKTAKLMAEKEQAQQDLQQHQHAAAKLQAQVESLQQALGSAKDELLKTKASMSRSISNLRSANRANVGELEKKHAQSAAEYQRRLTTTSTETILVNLLDSSSRKEMVCFVKRSDRLSILAEKLKIKYSTLLRHDIDFGIKCTTTPLCIHLVTDSSKTMEEVSSCER